MSSHHLRFFAIAGALILGAAVMPSSLLAQVSASADSARIETLADTAALSDNRTAAAANGPRIAPSGITRSPMTIPVIGQTQNRDNNIGMGSNLALMGVGAAGVVIGLLVGGDGGAAIAIGGGVLGLVGLYRYLR